VTLFSMLPPGMLTAKHVQRIKSASDAAEFAAKAGPKVRGGWPL
jgi:hypothetical protein